VINIISSNTSSGTNITFSITLTIPFLCDTESKLYQDWFNKISYVPLIKKLQAFSLHEFKKCLEVSIAYRTKARLHYTSSVLLTPYQLPFSGTIDVKVAVTCRHAAYTDADRIMHNLNYVPDIRLLPTVNQVFDSIQRST